MDANAYYEQKIGPEAALNEVINYYQECKKIGGTMISIWHNNFLGTSGKFKGWREAYRHFIALVQP